MLHTHTQAQECTSFMHQTIKLTSVWLWELSNL